jgi:hypothetical protein
MSRLQQDLFAFYQRQADRLIMLAEDCTTRATRARLIEMAGQYLDRLDALAVEQLTGVSGPSRLSH